MVLPVFGDHLQMYETWQSMEDICHRQLPSQGKKYDTPRKPRDLEFFFPMTLHRPPFFFDRSKKRFQALILLMNDGSARLTGSQNDIN